jgi:uncharacterized protein DUF4154
MPQMVARRYRLWAVVTAVVSLWSWRAGAQTATASTVKAAFLFNFAKFTEWPADALAPGGALMLCVINDGAVGDMLRDLAKDRTIDGHALVVQSMKLGVETLGSCRLLYASGLDRARSAVLLESIKRTPVFTVSDLDEFTELGGVAHLFVENGTMKFAINLEAAQRAGLHLSSKLLSLARIVKDDRNATHP